MFVFKKIKFLYLLVVINFIAINFLPYNPVGAAGVSSVGEDHLGSEMLLKLKNNDFVYEIKLRDETPQEFINNNIKNDAVDFIEPNYIYRASILEPNDQYYSQQVYLSILNTPMAWDYTTGSGDVVVAVIDSGVDIKNPDLVNNIWHNTKEIPNNGIDDDSNGFVDDYSGWDFIEGVPDPSPKFTGNYTFMGINHGTIIAGVIAAEGNNKIGITGLSWHSKIMPLRVLSGEGTGDSYDVARAIDYARLNGAKIINLSFIGDKKSETLKEAIRRAYQSGILLVAAAGNEVNQGEDLKDKPLYPVCMDGDSPGDNWVLGVASLDNYDHLASFSNYGSCVDITTPGVGIFSTLVKNDARFEYRNEYGGLWTGTSMSVPQVAGAAALLRSLKPELSVLELRDLLLKNSDNIDHLNSKYAGRLGRGKLNIFRVLSAAKNSLSSIEYRTDKIIVAPGVGGGPQIRTYYEGKPYSQFFGFDKNKRFGANIASRDLTGDGQEELVVSAEKGEEPWVQIFDINGNYKAKFLAYDKNMKQGVKASAGDINNDGQEEIITVPQSGYKPLVKIFNQTGNLLGEFYAFNQFFKGGLSISIGDVNNDTFEEIVVGAGPGTQSFVKIFNYHGQLSGQFIAHKENFFGGVNVAIGDVDSDGQKEIIVAPMGKMAPEVKIFNFQGLLKSSFLAYDKKFINGVNVAAGDINNDGYDEIITGPGAGGGPQVRVFNIKGKALMQFMVFNDKFKGGVKVSSGK